MDKALAILHASSDRGGMELSTILQQLAALGTAQTKKTLLRHGAVEPLFGVKIGDLKPLQKQLKGRQDIALALYATGYSDAMYLAGLIASGARMTAAEIQSWADTATWHMIAATPVAWVASEHPDGPALALQWIDSPRLLTATAGWSTLAALVTTVPDERFPAGTLSRLLHRVTRDIHTAPGHVAYAMNGFLIACGTYSTTHAEEAFAAARDIGPLIIDMGNTACSIPHAPDYILKSRRGAPVAPKRKTVRC